MKKSETESYCIIQDVAHINNLYGVYKTNDIKVTEYYLNLIVISGIKVNYVSTQLLHYSTMSITITIYSEVT